MGRLGDFYRKASSDENLRIALDEANQDAKENNITALIEVARNFGVELDHSDFDLRLGEDAERALKRGWSRREF
ncbi:MAG: hypothetical protein LBQ58_04230 [Synergistaceae bacterium]|jgi:hypothetical protein|nr:hypothetical protein [Synergistaceae bacterium]